MAESETTHPDRRDFLFIASGAFGAIAAGAAAIPLVDQMNAARDTLAVSQIRIDVSQIPDGQQITVEWRGKPVFVRHRSQRDIDEARAVDWERLRDPQPDEARVDPAHPELLVMVGVCTHLGCVPLADQGDYNGWFCPCHGSHYDTAGRIRKGPAPLNLPVPEWVFVEGSDNAVIEIG